MAPNPIGVTNLQNGRVFFIDVDSVESVDQPYGCSIPGYNLPIAPAGRNGLHSEQSLELELGLWY